MNNNNFLKKKLKYKYDLINYKFLRALKIFNFEFLKLKMSKKNKFRFTGSKFIKRFILKAKKTKKRKDLVPKNKKEWPRKVRKKFWKTKRKVFTKILKNFNTFNSYRAMLHFKKNYKYTKNYSIVHIRLTSNNIYIVVTKSSGHIRFWATSGLVKFKGSQKSSFVANLATARHIYKKIKFKKIKKIKIVFKGNSRKIRLRSILKLFNFGFKKRKYRILSFINLTPIPYNGCKKQKKRR